MSLVPKIKTSELCRSCAKGIPAGTDGVFRCSDIRVKQKLARMVTPFYFEAIYLDTDQCKLYELSERKERFFLCSRDVCDD